MSVSVWREISLGLRGSSGYREAMGALRLHGMKSTLDEVLATGIKQKNTPEKILLAPLSAEVAERRLRSIRYRMGLAKFPMDKDKN